MPLLYAAVRRTSWRQFAANIRPIFLPAVALVFVTTLCVAVVANAMVPGLPIAAAVVLGALIAPTRSPRPASPGNSGCHAASCRSWRARDSSTTSPPSCCTTWRSPRS